MLNSSAILRQNYYFYLFRIEHEHQMDSMKQMMTIVVYHLHRSVMIMKLMRRAQKTQHTPDAK